MASVKPVFRASYACFVDAAVFPCDLTLSDAGRLEPLLWLQRGTPHLYRLCLLGDEATVEGRGRVLRTILPSRSRMLSDIESAEESGRSVYLRFTDRAWWTIETAHSGAKIIDELGARGVPILAR
jgi:hypothetical protein